MGVYGLLRVELWGDALGKLQAISYAHKGRMRSGTGVKI
jgi:hypothetical protein